jgi:hypothetical protein
MRLIDRIRRRLAAEDGYTMIAVIGAIALVSMLAAATLAATNGDVNLVQYDLNHRRAHAAAEAGIADYSFHLNNDNSYWARCTTVPEPNAVNQVGSTAKRRAVPGPAGESYAIELLPASGQSACDPAKPTESMLEHGGVNTGSFRIRSTGYAGGARVSLVATYKRASLLDYIYFTQYETSDPVTYGSESAIEYAYDHCEKFYREGRSSWCDTIVFISGDKIKGPLHTNDEMAICGSPEFGRDASDVIEVSAPPKGWFDQHCSGYGTANPKFVGPLVTTAPVLKPPATNGRLKDIAGSEYTYSCQTKVQLEGTQMKVTTNNGYNSTSTSTVAFPESGVIYVQNSSCPGSAWPSCSSAYSPFTSNYPTGSDCGTVYVKGYYSGELTIAAENDIVIEGDLERTGTGLLGLIANNFVRVKHPVCREGSGSSEGCPSGWRPAETGKNECHSGQNKNSLSSPEIDAAILAIEHSFIVDHYDCGAELGTLTVTGAISQKYRGAVGTTGGHGYKKGYEYDDRLRYQEPPNFLDPIEPAWHIQRETLDFPG